MCPVKVSTTADPGLPSTTWSTLAMCGTAMTLHRAAIAEATPVGESSIARQLGAGFPVAAAAIRYGSGCGLLLVT